MSGKRRLVRSVEHLDQKKRNNDEIITGLLGTVIDGSEQVEVSGRTDFVWVRLLNNQSELVQAYNRSVAPIFDFPVLLRRKELTPSIWEVFDVNKERYQGRMGLTNAVPKHAGQHMFNPDAIGGDIVWTYDRQMMPLLVHPSGTAGAGNVVIEPDVYYISDQWHYAGNTGTGDLVSLKPTDSTAKMVLVYLDSFGNPQLTAGSTFSASITGIAQVLPFIPTLPGTNGVPLAGIRLVSGTARILWDNIYDLRPWIVADGFIPTGTISAIIRYNGVDQNQRAALNFQGNFVQIVDDPGNNELDIIITGSGGGHTILDEGTPVTQRSKLDFRGDIVFVVDNAGNDSTEVIFSGSAGGGGTYASLAEAQAGTVTDRKVNPYGLPFRVVGGGLFRRDQVGTLGGARGSGSADLQRERNNSNQVPSKNYSNILGGKRNRDDVLYGVLGGGYLNKMYGTGQSTAILGGKANILRYSSYSSIVAGLENNVYYSDFTIVGGQSNVVQYSDNSSIWGRGQELYTSNYVTLGGYSNYVQDSNHVFVVGRDHLAYQSSTYGTILNGRYNTLVSGTFGIASGYYSYVNLHGAEARSLVDASGFGRQNQRIFLLFFQETSNNTPTEMFLDQNGVHRAVLQTNHAWAFTILVSAKRNDATGEAAAYEFKGLINKDATAASTAIVGSVTKTVIAESTAAWDCNVTADSTNGALIVTVTGENGKTIRWHAFATIEQTG